MSPTPRALRRSLFASSPIVALAALALAPLACNAVLGNEPGVLAPEADAAAQAVETERPGPTEAGPVVSPPTDAGGGVADAEPAPTDGGTCAAGKKLCLGLCVDVNDPTYGCSPTGCEPCDLDHATTACRAGACAVGACADGYGDCNRAADDGCETDLSRAETCGQCNAACPPTAPVCIPEQPTFKCATGCNEGAPTLCGNQCVSIETNVAHCGACGNVCPAPANGTATCGAGTCGFTCKAGFHACGAECKPDRDPQACGAACTVCPVPANGQATCTNGTCGSTCAAGFHACGGECKSNDSVESCGNLCTPCPSGPNGTAQCTRGACGLACAAGFGNCNNNPGDGCEATLATDAANCGACGKKCKGKEVCQEGACKRFEGQADAGADAAPAPGG